VGWGALLHRLGERLVEVGDDVADALHADRQAHDIGAGAGGVLLRLGELAVRRRGRVDDQRAGVADIGEMREQLAALDNPDARFIAALDAEGGVETEPAPLGRYFFASA